MAESELAHDEETFVDAFFGIDGARVCRHDFGNLGGSRSSSDRNTTIHDVALGNDTGQLAVAQHGQGSHVVLHHEARGFEHSAFHVDGIKLAVFYDVAKGRHGQLLVGITKGPRQARGRGDRASYFITIRASKMPGSGAQNDAPAAPTAAGGLRPIRTAILLEAELRPQGRPQVVVAAVAEIDVVADFSPDPDRSGESFASNAGINGEIGFPVGSANRADGALSGNLRVYTKVVESNLAADKHAEWSRPGLELRSEET